MNKLRQELRKICVPINNFGCFQLLPTDASVDFFLVLSCLLDSSTTAFLQRLLSALDTNEAGNTPIEPNPGVAWEKARKTFYCILWCILCWTSHETVLLLLTQLFCVRCIETVFFSFFFFFILRDRVCNFENYSLGDFSHLMNGSGSLCHQPMNWSLVFLSFLCMFICLVKLIQYHGFKYHP